MKDDWILPSERDLKFLWVSTEHAQHGGEAWGGWECHEISEQALAPSLIDATSFWQN